MVDKDSGLRFVCKGTVAERTTRDKKNRDGAVVGKANIITMEFWSGTEQFWDVSEELFAACPPVGTEDVVLIGTLKQGANGSHYLRRKGSRLRAHVARRDAFALAWRLVVMWRWRPSSPRCPVVACSVGVNGLGAPEVRTEAASGAVLFFRRAVALGYSSCSFPTSAGEAVSGLVAVGPSKPEDRSRVKGRFRRGSPRGHQDRLGPSVSGLLDVVRHVGIEQEL